MQKKQDLKRVKEMIKLLSREIPDSTIALKFSSPFELLVATILSAQCTDIKVNQVTEHLFKKYRSAKDYAGAKPAELEGDIRPTGFYRNKAKSIQKCCQELIARFGGEIPKTLDELVTLPGVGRKTANVVLGNAFGVPGMVVDTHVGRIARRLGLTKNEDPVKVEHDLMALVPERHWTQLSHALIFHGRRICGARKPRCEECPVRTDCRYVKDSTASKK